MLQPENTYSVWQFALPPPFTHAIRTGTALNFPELHPKVPLYINDCIRINECAVIYFPLIAQSPFIASICQPLNKIAAYSLYLAKRNDWWHKGPSALRNAVRLSKRKGVCHQWVVSWPSRMRVEGLRRKRYSARRCKTCSRCDSPSFANRSERERETSRGSKHYVRFPKVLSAAS